MTTDTTNPNIKERPVKMHLRCDLTVPEKADLAATMAEDQAKLESLEDEKKAVASDYKSRIEQTQATIRRNSATYRQGWELRETECSEVRDYGRAEFRIVRLDTGEVVKCRPMTQDELTLDLPLEEDEAA